MRKVVLIGVLWLAATVLWAQSQTDPRSLKLMGIALEGSLDSLQAPLAGAGFEAWG